MIDHESSARLPWTVRAKTPGTPQVDQAPRNEKVNWLGQLDARLRPGVSRFESSAFVHILGYTGAVLSFAALVIGFFQFWAYLDDRQRELLILEEEREARIRDREIQEEERYERAWDRLLRKDAGDIRKGAALQALLDAGVNLEDLDLSCHAYSNSNSDQNCGPPIHFQNMSLPGDIVTKDMIVQFYRTEDTKPLESAESEKGVDLAVFDGNSIGRTDFSGNLLRGREVNSGVSIYRSRLRYAAIAHEGQISLYYNDLSFALISVQTRYGQLSRMGNNNLTGAIFIINESKVGHVATNGDDAGVYYDRNADLRPLQGPPQPQTFGWAWADAPPMHYDLVTRQLLPLPKAHAGKLVFYHPACRDHPAGEDWRNLPVSRIIGRSSGGVEPQLTSREVEEKRRTDRERPEELAFRENGFPIERCGPMVWQQAASLFPEKYD